MRFPGKAVCYTVGMERTKDVAVFASTLKRIAESLELFPEPLNGA